MPRPKNSIPSKEKTICLPEDLVVKVDLYLFSGLEGKVPFGAWQKFIVGLVNRFFEEQRQKTVQAENKDFRREI